jgi:hypothetical protein
MFVKFTDIINNQTTTINTDYVIYISHLEYSIFTFPEKDLNSLLATNTFSNVYYRNDIITRTDKDNTIINLIFTSDMRNREYYMVRKALDVYVAERKNIILKSADIFRLTMTNGQTFYCDNTIYNTICNNNDNLVIES